MDRRQSARAPLVEHDESRGQGPTAAADTVLGKRGRGDTTVSFVATGNGRHGTHDDPAHHRRNVGTAVDNMARMCAWRSAALLCHLHAHLLCVQLDKAQQYGYQAISIVIDPEGCTVDVKSGGDVASEIAASGLLQAAVASLMAVRWQCERSRRAGAHTLQTIAHVCSLQLPAMRAKLAKEELAPPLTMGQFAERMRSVLPSVVPQPTWRQRQARTMQGLRRERHCMQSTQAVQRLLRYWRQQTVPLLRRRRGFTRHSWFQTASPLRMSRCCWPRAAAACKARCSPLA
jgi:hypothetical protein